MLEKTGKEPVAEQIFVEVVGLDWTHPLETRIQHHTPISDLEPAGQEEEGKASWRRYTEPEMRYQGIHWTTAARSTRLKLAATNQQPIKTQKLAANKKFNQSTENTDTQFGEK
jgi:hypothetical protein